MLLLSFNHLASLLKASGDGSEIIDGKEVKPHSMPFMALLKKKKPVCGGTLINESWVLTAAHSLRRSCWGCTPSRARKMKRIPGRSERLRNGFLIPTMMKKSISMISCC
uniref:Peptidase S1 domain-containing protein n=1 Tax=Anabas testudineus TaxID=64144 RepID=A0AAQ6IIH2_ANATE